MKNNIIISLILIAMASTAMCLLSGCSKDDKYIPDITNKEERQLIKEGNKLFDEGNYREAEIMYNKAAQVNPNSPTANYNLALSLTKQLKSADNDSIKNDIMAHAFSLFELIPTLTKDSTLIAMAYHNMGNLKYENEAYKEAIDAYKQSLRHNPSDNDTRYNLRMAQLKLQEQQQQQQQQQDKNQQNQDQQDQKDQQDQDKQNQENQNKDQQNQDKQDQDKQNQDKQNQGQEKAQEKPAEQKQQSGNQQDANIKMDERNMRQVLKAAQDKEDAVQRKINNANSGQERRERQSSRNKW